ALRDGEEGGPRSRSESRSRCGRRVPARSSACAVRDEGGSRLRRYPEGCPRGHRSRVLGSQMDRILPSLQDPDTASIQVGGAQGPKRRFAMGVSRVDADIQLRTQPEIETLPEPTEVDEPEPGGIAQPDRPW